MWFAVLVMLMFYNFDEDILYVMIINEIFVFMEFT